MLVEWVSVSAWNPQRLRTLARRWTSSVGPWAEVIETVGAVFDLSKGVLRGIGKVGLPLIEDDLPVENVHDPQNTHAP